MLSWILELAAASTSAPIFGYSVWIWGHIQHSFCLYFAWAPWHQVITGRSRTSSQPPGMASLSPDWCLLGSRLGDLLILSRLSICRGLGHVQPLVGPSTHQGGHCEAAPRSLWHLLLPLDAITCSMLFPVSTITIHTHYAVCATIQVAF